MCHHLAWQSQYADSATFNSICVNFVSVQITVDWSKQYEIWYTKFIGLCVIIVSNEFVSVRKENQQDATI